MRAILRSACLSILVLLYAASGCTPEDIAGTEHKNLPPKVWLAVAPPEASTVDYRVHMFWNGHDPDGEIDYFEFCIGEDPIAVLDPNDTTCVWIPTSTLDSLFTFAADELADSSQFDPDTMTPYEFVRTHTFFIRSVDNDGARSTPAYRSFTARNLSPVVNITTPKSAGQAIAIVPPVITFQWTARDFIGTREETQDPHSVRSILLSTQPFGGRTDLALQFIRDNPDAEEWTDWIAYNAPGDSGRFYRPEQPLAFGSYVFAVQARDEAGASSQVLDLDRNVRLIRVRGLITGPSLFVSNRFMGKISTSTTNTPPVALSVPGGVSLVFEWSADASSYGDVVHSYRYGWDIQDINVPSQWDVLDTPFIGSVARSEPRNFFFGTHTLHIEVSDNSGAKSRVLIVVNIVPFTMERPLLVVNRRMGSGSQRLGGQLPQGRQRVRQGL